MSGHGYGYCSSPTTVVDIFTSPYLYVPVASYFIGTAIGDYICSYSGDTRKDIDNRRSTTLHNSVKNAGVILYTLTWPLSKWVVDGVEILLKQNPSTGNCICQDSLTVKKA